MKSIIKNEKENKVALAFVERLMKNDPEKESKEGILLLLLADEIQIFEKRYSSKIKLSSLSPNKENKNNE